MGSSKSKPKITFVIAVLAFGNAIACFAQAPLTITFDGPPVQPRGTAYETASYAESGMVFTSKTDIPGDRFTRNGGGIAGFPDNGTAYLQPTSSLVFGLTNGLQFSLVSVDLAAYSDVLTNMDIDFIGYKSDGSMVTNSFSGSGLNFQTYYFGPEFTNITRVEVPIEGDWSLDNLVFQPDPPVLSITMIDFLQFFPPDTYAVVPTPLLSFPTVSNQTYALDFSPDSSPGSWSVLPGIDENSDPASNMIGDGGQIQLVDTNAVISTSRFYRVRVLQ